jgi:hypothetical protein
MPCATTASKGPNNDKHCLGLHTILFLLLLLYFTNYCNIVHLICSTLKPSTPDTQPVPPLWEKAQTMTSMSTSISFSFFLVFSLLAIATLSTHYATHPSPPHLTRTLCHCCKQRPEQWRVLFGSTYISFPFFLVFSLLTIATLSAMQHTSPSTPHPCFVPPPQAKAWMMMSIHQPVWLKPTWWMLVSLHGSFCSRV